MLWVTWEDYKRLNHEYLERFSKTKRKKRRTLSNGANNHRLQIIANNSLRCKWHLSLQSQKKTINDSNVVEKRF